MVVPCGCISFLPRLVCPTPSLPDPPLHWMPLARLEKNRSRTPLLPEPTAMDMLYAQLKVNLSLCLCKRETHKETCNIVDMLSSSCVQQNKC